ncbi:paraquat-inducible protein A [Ningiella sp. W23]|uniref:paraquat-inducible protein A n=1 Tax=Ningiella sp. W23 TaxID=3023715 RepID=UPI003756D9BB
MDEKATRIACHDCDTLIALPSQLNINEKLCCPQCGTTQFVGRRYPIDMTVAYALCALICLGLAVSFPFLSMERSGASNTIILLQTPMVLVEDGYYLIATLVFAGVIVLPGIFLTGLLMMLFPMMFSADKTGTVFFAKLLGALQPWIMADVFVIAMLVALFKLIEMAELVLGISFWSYIAFTILLSIISNIVSKRQLWFWVRMNKHDTQKVFSGA